MNILSVFDLLYNQTSELLGALNLTDQNAKTLNVLVLILVILSLSWLLDKILNLAMTRSLNSFSKSKMRYFFVALIHNNVVKKTANLIPLIVFYNAVPIILQDFPHLIQAGMALVNILIILLIITIFNSIFRAITDIAETRPGLRDKPLESYRQVISILLKFIAVILIFSQVTGKEVWTFFTAMGAMSAVLLLVFKDTIMGFVASIQVTTNDMVRIGDWVEMPKYGADGDVIEITLNTVKIQNFDKTITTVPTYSLIADSFRNWRGMSDSGGRRIKRALNIKMSSVRFLSLEDLDHFSRIQILGDKLKSKSAEIEGHNQACNADKTLPLNGRNLTNLGVFREYVMLYLSQNPLIHKNMTTMVRQLAPTPTGIPLELYVFTTTTRWVEYEAIMADIFDHVIAAAPYFDLEIFEEPTGRDLSDALARAGQR